MGSGVESRFERYAEVMVKRWDMRIGRRRRAGICAG